MSKRLPVVIEEKLGRNRAHGLYYSNGVIKVDPRLTPKRKLEVFTHEFLHHALPDLVEEKITKLGKNLSDFLWKFGYRCDEEKQARALMQESLKQQSKADR